PNFNLFIYGGVNYEPYRKKFESLIGRPVDSIELYPASEGFFAFQNKQNDRGLLLQLDSGMFYEFVEASTFFDPDPVRLTIGHVELGVNYVMIISTNAGLWSYNIGDTVQFTSLAPYKVIVSGRIKHFISAFGEHVIGKEVEQAMQEALMQFNFSINEFTVAPFTDTAEGELPYHEWLIEFSDSDSDVDKIALYIDQSMQRQNSYYFDLVEGKVLQPLKITSLASGSFNNYMKSKGKLGGQNKIPRLSNDREIADQLLGLQA
ncbi:MAG: GH3 auxin-responsive promoter family protein, partial [Bacteroidota bacterium]